MRTVILLILRVHLAYGGTHSLKYFYTAVSGDIDFPEYSIVGLVNEVQFVYFDINIKRVVPKTEWIRQNEGADSWDSQTKAAIADHATFRNNIRASKELFNHSTGVHTFMRTYGCEWDDETGAINGIYQDGYDGEDFVTMDYKELRYIASVPQGVPSAQKWNNERGNLERWKNIFDTICVEGLQKYLQYGKNSLLKIVPPQVSLLQKTPSSPVTCHATGFYPKGVTITWMKNGHDHYEDVDLGQLFPNEDGTFQKTSTLRVTPDEWKKNNFSCVVEHQGKNVTEDKIKTNYGYSVSIVIIVGALAAAVVLLILIGVAGYVMYKKKQGSEDGSNSSAANDEADLELSLHTTE